MDNRTITKKKWLNIINTYYTGYYMTESERIKRRNYRALYLSNNDYLESNNFLRKDVTKRIMSYNEWYINYYNKNIILSENNNIL